MTGVANSWIRSVLCRCIDRQPPDGCGKWNSEGYEGKSLALLLDAANDSLSLVDIWGLSSGEMSLMEYHLVLPPWFCSLNGLFLFTGREEC